MSLTPKNWATFQHYKDRVPAWIKLHRGLLDDFAFSRLPVASRALAPMLWLLASEYESGKITATDDEIAFRFRMSSEELIEALKPLIEYGFFYSDSKTLARRKRSACLEEEGEKQVETEKEKESSSVATRRDDDWPLDFREIFWTEYPRKVGKKGALKELERVRKRGVPWEKLIVAVSGYAATADPQFTKHPQTWLSKGCWDDEPDTRKPNGQNSVLAAADRLIERVRQFDEPAPTEGVVRIGAGASAVRAISEGGCERSGDLRGDGRGDPGELPFGDDPIRH